MEWLKDFQIQVSTPVLGFVHQFWLPLSIIGFLLLWGLLFGNSNGSFGVTFFFGGSGDGDSDTDGSDGGDGGGGDGGGGETRPGEPEPRG